MAGKHASLSNLETRKQLLLAESEVNRLQLHQEWGELVSQTSGIVHRMQTIVSTTGTVMSTAIAAFQVLRGWRGDQKKNKKSWMTTMLAGLRMGVAAWSSLRRK